MVPTIPEQGPGQEPPNNRPGERIGRPEQVRIFGNYIHHNQHPRTTGFDNHAAGYGVDVHHGAWAQIYENVFDFNRHAIAAAGDTGGYEALRNLVLKGGGDCTDGSTARSTRTSSTSTAPAATAIGGQAGVQFWFADNAFQYLNGQRDQDSRPAARSSVDHPRQRLPARGARGRLGRRCGPVDDRDDLDVIQLGPNNTIEFDSYGRYGVCDFDGDGIDDLFLATGQTWWFSSFGEFQWTYLSPRTERLEQVRLGYFDDDQRCDVLTESGGEWVISSGGTGPWTSIGAFGAPLERGRLRPVRSEHPRPSARASRGGRRTRSGARRAANGW